MARLCSYTASRPVEWQLDVYDYCSFRFGPPFFNCPFCGAGTFPVGAGDEEAVLSHCNQCGYWRIVDLSRAGGYHQMRDVDAVVATAKHYELSAIDAPIADLRRFLRLHPRYMGDIDPKAFELLIRDCLRSVYPECEVVHLGGTGDGGVDLKIVRSQADHVLVQVKRRRDIESHEGIEVVRSLNGVLFREGVARGMVVTSAQSFTRGALDEAREAKSANSGYEMHLRGFPDIVQWLNLPMPEPYEPWCQIAPQWTFDRSLEWSDSKPGFLCFT